MDDEDKTKEQLINELKKLRQENKELKVSGIKYKQAEEVFQKSENKYRTLLENLSQKIFHKDRNSVYVSCNENYARDLKIKLDEVVGKTDYDFYPKELAEKYRADDRKVIELGEAIEVVEKYVTDGRKEIVQTVKTPIKDEKGNIIGILGIFWDITDRKKAEEELSRTKDYLNNIIESSLDCIVVCDSKGYIARVNKYFMELLGYKKEEVIGMHTAEIAPTEEGIYKSTTGDLVQIDKEFFNDSKTMIYSGLLKERKIKNWETFIIRKDRKVIPVEHNAVVLNNDEGCMIGTVSIIRDITGRKKKEKEIKETKDFLENVFRASVDGIITSDSKGLITMVNVAAEKMFGYSENELLGKHTTELAPKGTKYEERGKEIGALIKGHSFVTGIDYPWLRKDGSLVDVEMNIALLKDKEGNSTGAIGVIRDITERKKRQKEIKEARDFLENIFKTSVDGIMVTDSQSFITMVNQSTEKMLGYSRDELIGKHTRELNPKEKKYQEKIKEFISRLSEKGIVTNFEHTWLRKDGSLVDFEINVALLKDKEGNTTGAVGGIRDITERKKALDELKHHQQMLQISERNLKQFSRKILSVREEEMKKLSISLHDEIGSMAVFFGSNLYILEEEIKENNLQGAFDKINQIKNAVEQSIKRLKKVSIDLRPPAIEIVGLPGVLREYFSNIGKQTRIKIEFSENMEEKKINDQVSINLYRLTQEALHNIVNHAKAKRVKVKLYSLGNKLRLTISDDGKGFEVEKMLRKTRGLGIQGMRERVESLGGTFTITSVPQKGTEVTAEIPNMED